MTTTRPIRIVLFVLVWFSCTWFGSWEFNPNTSTRLFAAIGLVELHDAAIDDYADMTIDKARFGDHYYLDKAPGMTLMALPAIAIADRLTGHRAADFTKDYHGDFGDYMKLRLRVAVAIGPAILTAIAAVMILDMGTALAGSVAAGLFAALGFALGTPIWGWSTTLFGHAPVAALYVFAIWSTWRGTRRDDPAIGLALLTGASLGWAVVIEYQAALAGSVIALWAAWRYWQQAATHWPRLAAAAIGGVAALVPLALYNIVAFGTPFRIGYSGVVGWEGMHQGLFGLTWPNPWVLLAITFGPTRGLLWVAPVVIIAPYGLGGWLKRRDRRDYAIVFIAVSVVTLLVNSAYVYWDGGNSTGPRLAMPLAGALSFGFAALWPTLPSRGSRIACAALLGVSMFFNLAIAAADIFATPNFLYPIWSDVLAGEFRRGAITTIASDWFGWSRWGGFWIYLVVALPMLGWLVWKTRRNSCREY